MGKRSLLTSPLPRSVQVFGKDYPVFTDFRVGILLTELFSEEGLDVPFVMELAVKLLSPALWKGVAAGAVPLAYAFRGVLAFYGRGKVKSGTGGEPVLDFREDEERILAAFRSVYGVDLVETELHWWVFLALLRGLPADCPLMKIIRIRMTDPSGITDEDARRCLRQAKAAVRIRKKRFCGTTTLKNKERKGQMNDGTDEFEDHCKVTV